MFVTAIERASKFTGPVVISSRTIGGKVTSGCGSFVIVNDEGWILTAAHIFDADRVLAEHQKAHVEHLEKRKEIEQRTDLNINKKRKLISRLSFSDDWLSGVSFWWGGDGLSCKQVYMNVLADIAITKLENFKAAPNATFPKFGNPSVELPPGRSLCKTGFPFHSIESTYDEASNTFTFAPGALPIPRFPLDGILTRYQLVENSADKTRAKCLEMSSPGLRGQSGGPVFDREGVVWGIQVRTHHLPLGFQPEITEQGRKIAEHQFLNVGVAAYVSEIIALLKKHNVKHDVAT